MSTTIWFWRKKEITLEEMRLIHSLPFVGIFTFVKLFDKHGKMKYSFDMMFEAKENFDKALNKVNPRDINYKGPFGTYPNPIPKDQLWNVEINKRIRNESFSSAKTENISPEKFYKEFWENPERWWSSPQEVKSLLNDWKPKTENEKKFYNFYKTLSNLGFYCAIGG